VADRKHAPFTRSAGLYDILYSFKDYQSAASQLHGVIQAERPHARTLLDVACGTGRHLASLREWYVIEGLDLNRRLLAVARSRLRGVKLHRAHMASFDLHRQFDVVTCLFSSIGYLTTVRDLRGACRAFARHLKPGGILIVEPWLSPEQYWLDRVTLNTVRHEDATIAWMYTSKRWGRRRSVFDIHFLVGTTARVDHFVESHVMGLFTRAEYAEALRLAGFAWRHEAEGLFGRGIYIARLERAERT
jgi:SAM-dependent methyltransferase